MMQTSEQINEIACALAKAQAAMAKAAKDSTNPHFRSKYADLASISDACREALTANGIAVIQAPSTTDDGAVALTTRLVHASGQWFESTMACKPMKADAQGMGSVTSYLRRYSLAAMAGVVADDDDGEAAVGRSDMRPAAPQQRQEPRQQQAPARQQAKPGTAGKARSTAADVESRYAPFDEQNGDPIPFGEPEPDALVDYVNSRGDVKPMDLADAVDRLQKAYDAVDTLSNDAFDDLLHRNAGWLKTRAMPTWKALSKAERREPEAA